MVAAAVYLHRVSCSERALLLLQNLDLLAQIIALMVRVLEFGDSVSVRHHIFLQAISMHLP